MTVQTALQKIIRMGAIFDSAEREEGTVKQGDGAGSGEEERYHMARSWLLFTLVVSSEPEYTGLFMNVFGKLSTWTTTEELELRYEALSVNLE